MAALPTSFDSQHEDIIHDAQFDYYGRRLATCSSDRTIKVFDIDADKNTLVDTLKGHEGPVWSVSWAHPKFGTILASASYDGRVLIWKEMNGVFSKIFEHTKHSASVNSIAWAPHEYGLMLAAGSSDGTVSLLKYLDNGTWDDSMKITAHAIGVNAVAWAPASYAGSLFANVNANSDLTQEPELPEPKLASGGCDNLVKLWVLKRDTGNFENVETLEAHEDWVRDVAFAPNVGIPAHYLATCSQDKTVYVWTQSSPLQPFEKKKLHTFPDVAWRVTWSLAGDILAVSSGDNKVTLWRESLQGEWECVSTVEE